MKSSKLILLIIILVAFISLRCSSPSGKEMSEFPNIVLINVDDMGWTDVGYMGSEYYETPNIDAMASRGIVFTNAYAAASNCAPSRASMITGQWSPRHGIYTVGSSERGKSRNRKLIPVENTTILPDSFITLPEVLKQYGYTTCHAGKWHLGEDPCDQGFDINIGGGEAGNPGSYYPPYKNVPLDSPEEGKYLTEYIMDLTIDTLKSMIGSPFFLNYSPYAVHTPIQPVEEYLQHFIDKSPWKGQDNPRYATMVKNLDIQIGRLYSSLKDNNLLENTLIIFTSDNGGLYTVTRQEPLRAGKGSYYEGGIREPMFILWEGVIKGGSFSETPVTSLDFFPTILDIAGIDKPQSLTLDGLSILPVIENRPEGIEERSLFWHFPVYLEGGNEDCQDSLFRTRPGSTIRRGDWKMIRYYEYDEYELFNLKSDPGELIDLSESEPTKLEELKVLLERWIAETGAPIPVLQNPDFIKK